MRGVAAVLAALAALAGCVSTEGTTDGTDPRASLERQLGRADDTFNRRAFDEALGQYSALYLAALSGAYAGIAAEAAAQAATINALEGDLEESDRWMAFATRYAEDAGVRARSRVLLARGLRQWKRGEGAAARGTFTELVDFCEDEDLPVRAMQGASLAALVTEGEEQLGWSLRAIEVSQGLGEPRWEGALWTNHGWLLEARGEHGDALRSFERARALAMQGAPSPMDRLKADWNLGRGLRLAGRPAEARAVLEEAAVQGRGLYAARPAPRQAEWLGRVDWELGELAAAEGDLEGAARKLASARRRLEEAGAATAAPELLRRLDQRLAELASR
ncbi:MAG: hypothetical protein PVJ89_04185 [Planctomycetota bacterium]|jgi:hypothetical protein